MHISGVLVVHTVMLCIWFPRDTGVLTLNFVQTLCDCADELNGWPIMLLLGKGIMREVELLN